MCSLAPSPVRAMIVAGVIVDRSRSMNRIACVASNPSITGIDMSFHTQLASGSLMFIQAL